jgi:O-antigen/teichoic acid export membrane protein
VLKPGGLSKGAAVLRTSGLVRQAGIYTVSQFASRAVPFLLLPILTRYLSPADYGILAMFLLSAVLVEPFIGIGLVGAITVKYYDKATVLADYLGTGLLMVAGIAVPAGVAILLLGPVLTELTAVPAPWLALVVPLVVARTIAGSQLSLLRVRELPLQFAVLQNLQSVGVIVLAVVLVVGLGLGWQGRVGAELTTWCALALVCLVLMWRGGWIRFRFSPGYARDLASFGVPLIPHSIGAVLMFQTDRVLLTNLVGVEVTGLYTVAYQLVVVIEIVAVSFNYAYAPWLFRRLTDADDAAKRSIVRYTYVGFGGMVGLAVGAAIVMPWVGELLLDPAFHDSFVFTGWLALGLMFSGMYYLVANYIFYAQRTAWLSLVTISVGLLNIVVTYALITLNGAIGAAQAFALALLLSFLLTWLVSQRVYPMPWLGRLRTAPS